MRIIVFGRERTVRKLISLTEAEVEIMGPPGSPDEIMALPKQDSADLAIVDSAAEDIEAACRHITKFWDIPLVLVVGKKEADWKTLQSLGADGFVPDEAENAELAARLRAILRRFSPTRQVQRDNYSFPVSSISEQKVC